MLSNKNAITTTTSLNANLLPRGPTAQMPRMKWRKSLSWSSLRRHSLTMRDWSQGRTPTREA